MPAQIESLIEGGILGKAGSSPASEAGSRKGCGGPRAAEQADLKLQQLKQRALEADKQEVKMLENVLDLAFRLEEKANASSQQSHTNIIPNILSVQQNTVPPRIS